MPRFKKSMFKSKSFLVVDGELFLRITPEDGWYIVQGMNDSGLITQGRSIEEAIYMAHDAAKCLAESRAIIAAEEAEKAKAEKAKARTKVRRLPSKRDQIAAAAV